MPRATSPSPQVLFVMPPGGAVGGFVEHIGVGFLRAVLRRAGVRAAQYLPPGGAGLGDFARALREARPRVVGFTVYESNLGACRALAAVARQVLPEAVLLAGGPSATFSPVETLALLGVDGCLRGAGEGTIARVVGAALGARAPRGRLASHLADVPNLVLRDGAGVMRTAPASLASFQRDHFRHLDDLPSPYRAGLLTTEAAGLLTSRGCNQHCTYCSFAELSERRVAFHSVERVLDDLAAWRGRLLGGGRRPGRAAILDDAFTLSPERARAICEGIVARGLQLPFECETRADRVDGPLLRLMRRAGFTSVAFGLESAVPRVLRAVGKVQPPEAADDPGHERERAWLERFREAVRLARRAGLEVGVSVIAGLPGERAADLRATLDFVEALRPARYAHNHLVVLPGTPLHRDAGRHGLRAGRDPATGAWVTEHAYDARAVAPRAGSSLRRYRAEGGQRIVDALCGRARPARQSPGAAWAVVVHGRPPDAALAGWIREALAVGGLVVALADAPSGEAAWRAWAAALHRARAPHGALALLSPLGEGAYEVVGAGAPHHLALSAAWPAEGRTFEVAVDGTCRARVWLGSSPEASRPPARTAAVPQIADGCRWWSGWPRCASPGVLHVRADGAVAACWSGPALGRVGDPVASLRARAAVLIRAAGAGACPMGPPPGEAPRRGALERLEVTSQVSGRLAVVERGGGREARRRAPSRPAAPRRRRT